MSLRPSICSLSHGQTAQFTLLTTAKQPVTGPVTWAMQPPLGSLDATGLYHAPARIDAAATVTITATSGNDSGSAVAHLHPLPVVMIPSRVRLLAGETQSFEAVTIGGIGSGLRWNCSPGLGELDAGKYTAPGRIDEDREVIISAVSDASPLEPARAIIQLSTKPPRVYVVSAIAAYLVAVFCLTCYLVHLWPPRPPDRTDLDRAAAESSAAGVALDVASTKEAESEAESEQAARAASAAADEALTRSAREAAGRLEQARRRREQAEVKTARARAEHDAAKASFHEHDQQLERQLLWLVLVTGALGSFVYSARSFVDFVGNRALRSSWTVWYLLYPLIGAALALIFFIAIRGGLINPAAQGADINPYGLIAMSGLVGMFSKQATAKLGELFWNIFKTDRNDQDLKDKM